MLHKRNTFRQAGVIFDLGRERCSIGTVEAKLEIEQLLSMPSYLRGNPTKLLPFLPIESSEIPCCSNKHKKSPSEPSLVQQGRTLSSFSISQSR